ncbi:MAG: hypothetical protein ACXADC_05430 [Candidatus Thorarchaeota archaeon]
MIRVFIKLLNKGLSSSEYDKFPFQIRKESSIRDLIDDLMKEYRTDFEVYLEDKESKALCNDAIILVNGKMVVAGWKLKMGIVSRKALDNQLLDGDTIVFMIVTGGG